MEEQTGRKWFWKVVDFINPLRDPSLTVAAVLTFIEEVGQRDAWYWIIVVALVNWVAVRGVVWLVVNFTFAFTFISRRLWWALQHPRLAWRILDAVGHEEIVIGSLSALTEVQDGHMMLGSGMAGSGIHILGELPAGHELPMLGMPNGQMVPDLSGFFPGASSSLNSGSSNMYGGQGQMPNSGFVSPQGTDGYPQGFPQNFPQQPSQEEERLRQQLAAYSRLIDDWMQFTEDKWRTVSDSQLGWKPLRGRWGSWDDIFQDAYAAKTSDPMAQAAQSAGDATARRYDASKEKGSAASAVACFMRDMMTLRRGLDMTQPSERATETPSTQPAVQPFRFGTNSGSLSSNTNGTPRSSFIRRPTQVFVDADAEK